MQSPSFKSLISAPWAKSDESTESEQAYHLTEHQNKVDENTGDEDNLEHTAILGYN